MAKIVGFKEIALNKLKFSKGQMRTLNPGVEIEELAESIRVQGLLQPIVVALTDTKGVYEILLGQRRYYAFKMLKKDKIICGVVDKKVSLEEAKAISITENLMKRDPDSPDYRDGCIWLYKRYLSVEAVAKKTGISATKVRKYVAYDRLPKILKDAVDKREVQEKDAVDATDSVLRDQKDWEKKAYDIAKEFKSMNPQQKTITSRIMKENPKQTMETAKKIAKSQETFKIIIIVGAKMKTALDAFALAKGTTLTGAVYNLVEEGLSSTGLTEDENN